MKPASGSAIGSRVVTTRPTRSHTTPAAAKIARLTSRSRDSMSSESRASDPSSMPGRTTRSSAWSIGRPLRGERSATMRPDADGGRACRISGDPSGGERRSTGRCRGTGTTSRPSHRASRVVPGPDAGRGVAIRSRALASRSGRHRPGRPAPSRGSGARPGRAAGRSWPRSPSRRSGAAASRERAGALGRVAHVGRLVVRDRHVLPAQDAERRGPRGPPMAWRPRSAEAGGAGASPDGTTSTRSQRPRIRSPPSRKLNSRST